MSKATLLLEDGTRFEGQAFGHLSETDGEVVFCTAMTGYTESLTDPSYAGQLLVMTYPLAGNYGVPPRERWESDRIHVRGLIVADYSQDYSHWLAETSLGAWMEREHVPGVTGVNTRMLTKLLREKGVMRGRIVQEESTDATSQVDAEPDYAAVNWVERVSCREPIHYNEGAGRKVVLVDCGVKANIIRCLVRRGCEVVRVPWNYDYTRMDFDGLFLANGPGNPDLCGEAVDVLKRWMSGTSKPICGICMGNQLLAKAAGATIYKLKYGHRSHNQPVRLVGTERCFVTAQNHGFAVDAASLPNDWQELFVNMNDGSNEGIRHRTNPWFSAQFHPEACSGPTDTEFLFDEFVMRIKGSEVAPLSGCKLTSPQNLKTSKPQNLKKVLLLGSGALKIGQAGEFDYSGSQAIKALREEGIRTVLINPNIATVQTSEGVADKVYFQPVRPNFVERVIEKERPDGIMLAFGGQTALNCGVELFRNGVLQRYGVSVLGTPVQAIIDTEDRERFVQRLDEIGVKTIRSQACGNVEETKRAARQVGYPVILRAAYALGGLGSGFCDNEDELTALAEKAFAFSPQVLVEKSLKGWKEIEYEVVRDCYDNCITICNMENFDPLGIHTGESIVVAPSQTLSSTDYHKLRSLAISIVRHIGIVGECNVQYAYDPQSEDYRVIEVNARLSRSSALASKATGYPLAFIAAKLGLGYGLFELKNSVTKTTSAFFEPALDYVVCKIPRWDLSKFHGVSHQLGSSMKSVGEVMAIGRTFEEALQKGLRMIGQGMHGFVENKELRVEDVDDALLNATDNRIFVISKAMQRGYSVEKIHQLTRIDRWFLQKLHHIVDIDQRLRLMGRQSELAEWMENEELYEYLETPEFSALLHEAKVYGFSDFQVARALGLEAAMSMEDAGLTVRQWRKAMGILPTVHQVDTLAAEYPAQTNYLYLSHL